MDDAAYRAEMARVVRQLYNTLDPKAGFTGQITVELNCAEGDVKTMYVNTREGVRLGR